MTANNITPEERAKQNALVANCVKGVGAVFILAAPLVAFNVFGLADLMGLHDGFFEYLMGGLLLVMGLADFFVIAPILRRAGLPKDGNNAQ